MIKVRFARLGYTALRHLHRLRAALPLPAARNFLLLQHHRALGPTVIDTTLVRALHATLPDARIVIAASGMALDIFANNPAVERLLPAPDPRFNLRGAVRTLRRANLFSGEPFIALLTAGNTTARHHIAALLAGAHNVLGIVHAETQPGAFLSTSPYLSAAPVFARPASTGSASTGSASPLLRYDRRLSRVTNLLQFIPLLGHGAELTRQILRDPAIGDPALPEPDLQEPRIFPGPSATAAAAAILRDHGIAPGRPFAVLITQTRPDPNRTWPAESFRDIARWLHRRHGLQIVFTGTAAESAAIEAIRGPLDIPTVSLAGRTTLPRLAAVLAAASLGVGFDTGTMHLARAVALPLVIIAPPSGAPIDWLPIGHPRARILYSAYRPPACDHPIPGELSTESVQHEAEALLHLYPPTQGWRTPNLEANRTEDVTPRAP